MLRNWTVATVMLSLLACTGAATEPSPAPVAGAPAPPEKPAKAGKRGKSRKGGDAGASQDPQPKIPATGPVDPIAGLGAAELCRSDSLLMVKYTFEELQGGKCAEVCCAVDAEHWCCGLDWPFSDVPSCHAYAEMRNGLFSRYGYPFTEQEWKDQFGTESYYRRREDFDAKWLSAAATKNVATLKAREEKKEGCMDE